MKQAKKKTEINSDTREDKLALMVQRGFFEVNKNIKDLSERVGGLETRVGGLETRVGGVEAKVEGLDVRMERVEEKMDKVEGQLSDVLDNQDKMIKDLEDLKEENAMDIVIHGRMEKRITHLEKDVSRIKAKVKV